MSFFEGIPFRIEQIPAGCEQFQIVLHYFFISYKKSLPLGLLTKKNIQWL